MKKRKWKIKLGKILKIGKLQNRKKVNFKILKM